MSGKLGIRLQIPRGKGDRCDRGGLITYQWPRQRESRISALKVTERSKISDLTSSFSLGHLLVSVVSISAATRSATRP